MLPMITSGKIVLGETMPGETMPGETMPGLHLLGAEDLTMGRSDFSPGRLAAAAGAAVLGAALAPAHPILAAVVGFAAGGNVHDVATGRRTPGGAARRVGQHVVAAAGSLALPAYPVVG